MPLDRQKQVVDDIKARLRPARRSDRRWSASRARGGGQPRAVLPLAPRAQPLSALAGVFLVLFAARRRAREPPSR